MPWVIRQRVGHGLDDVRHGIQTNHIGRAIGSGLRTTQQRASERIDFIKAQLERSGVMNHRQNREHADAIADEIGRVFGDHHTLA